MNPPDIHDYVDYRAYLREWFVWKKNTNKRFSHRAFVRRVGGKSPSLLADLIAGRRRMTKSMVSPFGKAMALSADAQRYLGLLVEFDQCKDPADKTKLWETISARRRWDGAHQIEGESFQYLSDWCYSAIRELALRSDFRAEPEWIAKTMRPRITVARARRALEALFALGMLVRAEDGSVSQADGALVTPTEVLGLAVHNYHLGMLDRAKESITTVPAAERHLTGVTVCVPESLLPTLKQEINQFAERMLDLCDGAEGPPQRVYQCHIAAFPLSARTEDT